MARVILILLTTKFSVENCNDFATMAEGIFLHSLRLSARYYEEKKGKLNGTI